jgi:uncharacterized protein YjbK|tara:strand:- start:79 stop:393 length:315 start_codon:yes stop_codon:yes gene_type:complete
MLVKLVEISMQNAHTKISENAANFRNEYMLKEIYINPEHVVFMRENNKILTKISKTLLSEQLHPEQEFTMLRIDIGHSGMEVTVIGSLSTIQEKLNLNKQLLKG